jgi:hypothetical protein
MLAAITQSGQRRLEVMRDIVGHLFQSAHQSFDPIQHGIDGMRQAVEFIAAAGDRQTA